MKIKYQDFTVHRNYITKEYNEAELKSYMTGLTQKEKMIVTEIKELEGKKHSNINLVTTLKKEEQEKNSVLTYETVKESELQREFDDFNTSKSEILKIIREYQLPDTVLYQRDIILERLDSELRNYDHLIQDMNQENKEISKKIATLQSGRSIQLESDLEQAFKENNIEIEFGMEWLKNYSASVEYKEKLVKENPFIPYSIIMSIKDLEKLQKINLGIFTSTPLPIIQREGLEEYVELKASNQVITLGKINFILSFNNQLLNEEHLAKLIKAHNMQIRTNTEKIETAKNSRNVIQGKKHLVGNFKYTIAEADEIQYNLSSVKKRIGDYKIALGDIQSQQENIQKENSAIESQLRVLGIDKGKLDRKVEDLDGLIQLYPSFLKNLSTLGEVQETIEKEKSEVRSLDELYQNLKNDVQEITFNLGNLDKVLDENKSKLAKYQIFTEGTLTPGEIFELESELKGLIDKSSSDLQSMRDTLDKNLEDERYFRDKIAELAIAQAEYEAMVFDRVEFKKIKQTINEHSSQKQGIDESIKKGLIAKAGKERDLYNKREKIVEQCNGRNPKAAEVIGDIEFDKRKSVLIKERESEKMVLGSIEKELQKMGTEKVVLAEYEGFKDKANEVKPINEEISIYRKRLMQKYKGLKDIDKSDKESLAEEYHKLEKNFEDEVDIFKQLFGLLSDDRKFNFDYATNVFNRAVLQIDNKLKQFSIDIQKMSEMEDQIAKSTFGYVRNVYDEMDGLDKNSTIEIHGDRKKMLMIDMPKKEKLDEDVLRQYIKGTIHKCRDLYKESKALDNLLENEVNTYSLFDRLIGINNVTITILKIEPNAYKKKTWKQVIDETSGGEKFVSAFVVFISLLTYMRGNNNFKVNEDSKVLIMDNPFGPITSEHLLIPLFEVAKKYNTQLICLTDLKEHTIYDRFNLIYAINIEKEEGRNEEYIEVKVIKKEKNISSSEDEVLASSLFKVEQQSFMDILEKAFDTFKE